MGLAACPRDGVNGIARASKSWSWTLIMALSIDIPVLLEVYFNHTISV